MDGALRFYMGAARNKTTRWCASTRRCRQSGDEERSEYTGDPPRICLAKGVRPEGGYQMHALLDFLKARLQPAGQQRKSHETAAP
jgi:hypothetical protein